MDIIRRLRHETAQFKFGEIMNHDLEKMLLQQAGEIAALEVNGWGIAMRDAAKEIQRLKTINTMLVKTLNYVLEDEGLIPRATSACRRVIRNTLGKYGELP